MQKLVASSVTRLGDCLKLLVAIFLLAISKMYKMYGESLGERKNIMFN